MSKNYSKSYSSNNYSKSYTSNNSSNNYSSSNKYYAYTLNLESGKKYVGITSNPEKRINDHFEGNGSKWCQKYNPISINSITACKSYESAKKAERIIYYNMKNYHGSDKVRGAGNTSSIE